MRRHDSVAAALEALGAAVVHVVGQPISHAVKAGFKRRGEVGPLLDDSGPCWVGWAWCEDSHAAVWLFRSMVYPCCNLRWKFPLSGLSGFLWSRACGVAQFCASVGNPVVRFVSARFCASGSILLMSRAPLHTSGVVHWLEWI